MQVNRVLTFEGVREWDDEFLALFPHRFDYIWAEHSSPGRSPQWQTESRHPLSDRLIRQGAYLYGVRFGAETTYALLDIDTGSSYHPTHDPFAISRIVEALEPLGIFHYVACTSSYSGGLHLYFPLQHSQSSWQLAIALACLLENAGFKLQPGQLEIFPNPKPFATDGAFSLFNAHRLPLQVGSYLLNQNWQPIWTDSHRFADQWNYARQHNDVDKKNLKYILKQVKRKQFGISGRADKFINDLNAEIELGWTGPGQTNRLLGRITMRAYIFHHALFGGEPLEGKALVDEIIETARSLPGYKDWCRHQHEIEQRAHEWARCVENSHYFHFGYPIGNQSENQDQLIKRKPQDPEIRSAIDEAPSWNQQQSSSARDRIRRAIADLLEKQSLPAKPTARFQALLTYGIGGASLYRHRGLWHPAYIKDSFYSDYDSKNNEYENNPDHLDLDLNNQDLDSKDKRQLNNSESKEEAAAIYEITHEIENTKTKWDHNEGESIQSYEYVSHISNCLSTTSLFPRDGGNVLSDKGSGDRSWISPVTTASNSLISNSSGSVSVDADVDANVEAAPFQVRRGVKFVQQVLAGIQAQQPTVYRVARTVQVQHQQAKAKSAQQRHIAQMQRYLASDDPILVAEAMAWAQMNPGVLQANLTPP